MLFRKISKKIESHLLSDSDQIMMIEGARQIGKSFIIREVGKRLFKNFIEINFITDAEGEHLFSNIHTVADFYFTLSSVYGSSLGNYGDTLIFLDEIQQYPQYFTLLKFFRENHRFHFIASGSLLGITLKRTKSIPVGSVIRVQMYQLDFEEFLLANGYGQEAIANLREKFMQKISLTEEQHLHILNLFKRYLLVGGLPDVVNEYLVSHNIMRVRELQNAIMDLYKADASQYEEEANRNLQIKRIYDMVPSQMENKKKRIVAKDIKNKQGDRFDRYQEEFEYLLSSGIVHGVNAISNPHFPLAESLQKNLIKLYLNDTGLLTSKLYGNNLMPVLEDQRSINLGALYESVVAQELKAHGYTLFYYDNRQKGEVDFIIDDYEYSSVLPIEVKSGRDYSIHSALNNLLSNDDYNIHRGIVLSNNRDIRQNNGVFYLPIYFCMFITKDIYMPEDKYIF